MRRSDSQEFKNNINARNYTYSFDKSIGHGSFSVVHAGTLFSKSGPERRLECAVKISGLMHLNVSFNERNIHSQLTGDMGSEEAGVVNYMTSHIVNHNAYSKFHLVTSRCDTTLNLVIAKIKELSETRPSNQTRYIDCFFVELLVSMRKAFNNLARHSIVHADIKPQNIGVRLNPTTGKLYCVLLDFGSAKKYSDIAGVRNKLYGSALYMAPEICEAFGEICDRSGNYKNPFIPLSYPPAVDVYSLGMVLSAMLSASRKLPPIQLSMPLGGMLVFAYVASQGVRHGIARDAAAASSPSLNQEAMLRELLALSPVKCIYKLVEYMRATLPEKRPRVETLNKVIDHLEKIVSVKVAKMSAEDREEMNHVFRELITPCNELESDFRTSAELEAAVKM